MIQFDRLSQIAIGEDSTRRFKADVRNIIETLDSVEVVRTIREALKR
jgi:hypothetical protein